MADNQRGYFRDDDHFMDWLLAGVGSAKKNREVKITITADRGVVQEVPRVDPLIAEAEDQRVKQVFFDTINLDSAIPPPENTLFFHSRLNADDDTICHYRLSVEHTFCLWEVFLGNGSSSHATYRRVALSRILLQWEWQLLLIGQTLSSGRGSAPFTKSLTGAPVKASSQLVRSVRMLSESKKYNSSPATLSYSLPSDKKVQSPRDNSGLRETRGMCYWEVCKVKMEYCLKLFINMFAAGGNSGYRCYAALGAGVVSGCATQCIFPRDQVVYNNQVQSVQQSPVLSSNDEDDDGMWSTRRTRKLRVLITRQPTPKERSQLDWNTFL
ncbi:hypothetical protein J6590_032669 [Homalodisca vitripennis]|nr:hypothetical protein J6590_032669 [Homalodisca vitripennis]